MFQYKLIAKVVLVFFLSMVGVSLVSLMVSSSAAAMLPESVVGVATDPRPFAVQSVDAVTDTTVANFQSGTGTCYAAPSAGRDFDGELTLTPTLGITFTGSALPAGWYSDTYSVDGNGVVGGGVITLAGAYAGTSAVYSPSLTIEFSATFGAAREHVGLAESLNLNSNAWAIFSTGSLGDNLYARTSDGAADVDSPLGIGYLNAGHRFRIAWTASQIVYSIDGLAVVTHTTPQISVPMRPILSSGNSSNNLVVDWLRLSPYATPCSFQSRVLDAGQSAQWLAANVISQLPAGTTMDGLQTRSGGVNPPDLSWSAWAPLSGTTIASPKGRYIQYRLGLTTTDTMFAPALESVALTFSPAGQTIEFNPLSNKTYGNPPFTVVATATSGLSVTFTASGTCGVSVTTVTLNAAGSCAVIAHQPGDAIYDPAPDVTQTFTIAKASATITVTPYTITYDGNAHTATGAVTGVKGESLSGLNLGGTTHISAGNYLSDPWTFIDVTGNYSNTSGTVHDSIAKASASITVTPYAVAYDGNPHTATGASTGVKGETLSGLNLGGTTHTNAGDFLSDPWTFIDVTGNYSNTSGTVHDSITKVSATITVTPYIVTYDGNSHTATGAATGAKGESLSGLNLGGTTHTNANDYPSDPWTFVDVTGNYSNTSGIVHNSIAKASATITVTAYAITYDGNAHTATGAATGAKGESLSGLNLGGTSHTNAGDYPSDPWTFADVTGNYTNTNGTVHDTIAKASATITVTPYAVTYDRNPHTATGAATGVKGESLLSGLTLTTTHTNAGDYPNDTWSFTDVTGNYSNTNGTVHNSIAKATQSISFTAITDKVIIDPPFTVTASASSNLTVTFTASGNCSVTSNTVTLLKPGSCTVTAQQIGDSNYNAASDFPRTFTITGSMVYLPLIMNNFP